MNLNSLADFIRIDERGIWINPEAENVGGIPAKVVGQVFYDKKPYNIKAELLMVTQNYFTLDGLEIINPELIHGATWLINNSYYNYWIKFYCINSGIFGLDKRVFIQTGLCGNVIGKKTKYNLLLIDDENYQRYPTAAMMVRINKGEHIDYIDLEGVHHYDVFDNSSDIAPISPWPIFNFDIKLKYAESAKIPLANNLKILSF